MGKKIRRISRLLMAVGLLFPVFLFAQSFERNLYFGLRRDPDVERLQQFLTAYGYYSGPITGNFLSLTVEAVKKLQSKEGISPVSGYFGPKTRKAVNKIISSVSPSPTVSPLPSGSAYIEPLKAQIALLGKQIALLMQQLQELLRKGPSPSSTPTPSVSPSPTVSPSVSPTISPTVTPTPSSSPAPTFSASLQANPNSGTGFLTNVAFTAEALGTATGNINYTFYCNRSDSGTNITAGYNHKKDNITDNPYTVQNVCSYSLPGAYTAKVIIERNSLASEARVTINVFQKTVPAVDIKANSLNGPININYNGSVDLSWTSANSTGCTASGDWSGDRPLSGSETVSGITSQKTFTLICTGSGGTAFDSVTVNTSVQPTLFVTLGVNPNSGKGSLMNVAFTAAVSGTATGNINYTFYCNRSDSGTNITAGYNHKKDNITDNPYTVQNVCSYSLPGTYTAKAIVERQPLAAEYRTTVIVSVANRAPSANAGPDKEVVSGQSVTLEGVGSDPDNDPITYSWSCTGGSLSAANISQPVYTAPSVIADTNYNCTLTVSDDKDAKTSDVVIVTVKAPTLSVVLTADPSLGTAPLNGVDLTAAVSGTATGNIIYKFDCQSDNIWDYSFLSTPDTSKTVVDACNYALANTYIAKVYVERGGLNVQATATITVSAAPVSVPTIDIKANSSDGPITINYNTAATLSWTSANTTSCTASNGWSGTKATSGSESTGNLTSSKTYTLSCSGAGGSASDSVTVNVSSPPPPGGAPRGISGDFWADVEIGRRDFGENSPNEIVPYKLFNPGGVAVDRTVSPGRLYVWDCGNSRILGVDLAKCYNQNTPCTADLIFGQPSGYDYGACNQDASYDTYPNRRPASASTLCGISEQSHTILEDKSFVGLAVDNQGNLYVPDAMNNRILKFNKPFESDTVADEVWGQADFSGNLCNRTGQISGGASPTNNSLCFSSIGSSSMAVGFDGNGNLWIADAGNNRVLRFPKNQTTGQISKTADLVLGQPNFTTGSDWSYGSALNRMHDPKSVSFDSSDRLYIADIGNDRILVFNPPFSSGMSATRVFASGFDRGLTYAMVDKDPANPVGQVIWTYEYDEGEVTLWNMDGTVRAVLPRNGQHGGGSIAVDNNNNVLSSSFVYGQDVYVIKRNTDGSYSHWRRLFSPPDGYNLVSNRRFATPAWVGVTTAANQLIVGEGRLLFWNNPGSLTNGQAPDGYVGSSSFTDRPSPDFTQVKSDDSNRVWVTKASEIRVYQAPLTIGSQPIKITASPVLVLGGGQIILDAEPGGNMVMGLAPTPDGRFLWISQPDQHRVLRIRDPLTNPIIDVILGQTSLSGNRCNRGLIPAPNARTGNEVADLNMLCYPGALSIDKKGNLYVSDHVIEAAGNWRLLMFGKDLFPNQPTSVIYAPKATKSFPLDPLGNHHTFEPAFDSSNRMVVGLNPYSGKRFVEYYNDPTKVNPNNPADPNYAIADGKLQDFYNWPVAATFDSNDNLYVYDANHGRVMIYKQPFGTPTPPMPTLSVTLTANPSSGTVPLSEVGLTAAVSGTATGNINYTFYCNRSDTNMNITSDYNKKVDNVVTNPLTAASLCSYATAGTYTAKVIIERGSMVAEARATITVAVPAAPTVDLKANSSDGPITINYNTSATLSWASTNATSCVVSGDWSGTKATSGSESTGNLTSSKTYTLSCSGAGGSASDSVTVNVSSAPTLSVSLSANPASGTAPLNGVDLTAAVSGTATGNIIYKFDCQSDGVWDYSFLSTPETSKTVVDACNYLNAVTYTAKVQAERGGLTATNTATITVSPAPSLTLTVSLTAIPSSGTAPLNGVDLTAAVAGTAIGTVNYKFDCTNDGSWEYAFDNLSETTKTVLDACNYSSGGSYTAKVQAERGGLTVTNTTTISVSNPPPALFNLSVLLIGYNPVEDGKNLAETYYAWQMGGRTAGQTEDYIANETIMAFKELSGNTINYTVAKKIQIDHFTPYTNGFNYNFASFYNCAHGDPGLVCETQKYYFDYISWTRENRICEIAEENNIDEIWVISAPFVMTWENFMIGPDAGFGVNGPDYTIPECKKHYIAVNGTYERPEAVLHVYGHRIEATMSYLTSYWSRTDYQNYWENFSTVSRYGQPCNDQSGLYSGLTCGNAHFPANGVCHYDVDNLANKDFNCKDWKNFPNFAGEKENINCSVWGCSDIGWQKYWFSSLPRGSGDVEMMSTTNKKFFFKKNWWYYLLYPENAISLRKASF